MCNTASFLPVPATRIPTLAAATAIFCRSMIRLNPTQPRPVPVCPQRAERFQHRLYQFREDARPVSCVRAEINRDCALPEADAAQAFLVALLRPVALQKLPRQFAVRVLQP